MLINFNPSPQFIYRGRCYYREGDRTWHEPCPIIKQSKIYITVMSQTFTKGTDCGYELYKGGEFSVNAKALCENGKAYHSRHGEYFYLHKPTQGDPFPSIDLMNTEDAVTMAARKLGWEGEPRTWAEWQRMCWLAASFLKIDLREAIDRWKVGGDSVFEEFWAEVREQRSNMLQELWNRRNGESQC